MVLMDEEFELNDLAIQAAPAVHEPEARPTGSIASSGDTNNAVMADPVIDPSVSLKSTLIRRAYKIWEWLSRFSLPAVGAAITLALGLIVVPPAFAALKLAQWTAFNDFREQCLKTKPANRSQQCRVALESPLPPPPGVNVGKRAGRLFARMPTLDTWDRDQSTATSMRLAMVRCSIMVVAFLILVGFWVLILHRLGRVEPRSKEGTLPWNPMRHLLEDPAVGEPEEAQDSERPEVTLYPEVQPVAISNRRMDAGILADEMADELDQMVRRDNQRRAKRRRRVTTVSKREEEHASREKAKEALRQRFDPTKHSEPDQLTMSGPDNSKDGEYTRYPLPEIREWSPDSVNNLFPRTSLSAVWHGFLSGPPAQDAHEAPQPY